MARTPTRGDVSALILAVLGEGALHGYAIAREVERRSESALALREGSLYPALRDLEASGYIVGQWDDAATPTGTPARKTYKLTATGQTELENRAREWQIYARALNGFLGGKLDAEKT